jgi:superfamily II DNA or RNA helicase
MNLRPYQIEADEKTEAGWAQFDRQLGVAPTGSGKTVLFAKMAQRRAERGERALIMAHRDELIDQAVDKLAKAAGIPADVEKADRYASLESHVVVGSVQTLMRPNRRERFPVGHFSLIVLDECHHAISKSNLEVLRYFDQGAKVLGVTATHDRGDKKNLGQYFQNIAFEVKLLDLINQGYLSRITIKAIPISIDLNSVRQTAGDFNETDLGHAIEPYLDRIALAIREQASFRRVLGFAPLIDTARKASEACAKVGLRSGFVYGQDPDRDRKRVDFANWQYDVMWNAMLWTEGFDDPGIDCIVILRPTRSRPHYAQMVGRGTRIEDTKENLLLLDFLWLHEKHSISRPADLIAQSSEESEVITELAMSGGGPQALDLQDLATEAASQREATLRKRLEEQRKKKAKYISAEDFALQHNSLAIAEYEPTMFWELAPVTPKQKRHLTAAGIDTGTVKGVAHASKLLDIVFKTQKMRAATPGQRRLMTRMKWPGAATATQADARRFFAQLKGAPWANTPL